MKERSILMSAPMVRAILADLKGQTRRVVQFSDGFIEVDDPSFTRMQDGYPDGSLRAVFGLDDEPNAFSVKSPYGQPGDRLWVKETFFHDPNFHGKAVTWYRADNEKVFSGYWKPSIFMPRKLSRITLEVTGVRVERLNKISEADAIAEGIEHLFSEEECRTTVGLIGTEPKDRGWKSYTWPGDGLFSGYSDPRKSYETLWESINGPGSWAANPWVWVVEFQRVEGGAA